MLINDIIKIYQKKHEQKITINDIKRSFKTINTLGTGCQVLFIIYRLSTNNMYAHSLLNYLMTLLLLFK